MADNDGRGGAHFAGGGTGGSSGRGRYDIDTNEFLVDPSQFHVDRGQFADQTDLLDRSYYTSPAPDPDRTLLADPFSDAGVTGVPDVPATSPAPTGLPYYGGEFVADPGYGTRAADQLDEPAPVGWAYSRAAAPTARIPAAAVPEPGQANVRTRARDFDRPYAQAQHQVFGSGPDVPSSNGGSGGGRGSGHGAVAAAVLLLILGIGLLGVAGYFWFDSQQKYQVGIDEYSDLQTAVTEDAVSGRPVVDFAALKARNQEIVGWVQVPGTRVNYPVTRHEDNDYYLDHTFLGTYNLAGSVFMDYRSSPDLTDRTTVIYGHHLKNGEMFARIADLSDQAQFDQLGNIYYITDDNAVHVLTPMSCMVVSGTEIDVLKFDFESDEDFKEYVQALLTKSRVHSPAATAEGVSHVYLLSTCSYERDNDRTILVCADWGTQGTAISDATVDLENIQTAADTLVTEGDANVGWQ